MNLPNLQSLIDQLFDDLITVWLLDELWAEGGGMQPIFGKLTTHQALAIGSALLWGIVEFIALQRARAGFSQRRIDTVPHWRTATQSWSAGNNQGAGWASAPSLIQRGRPVESSESWTICTSPPALKRPK
jgi:hypothetical protein